MTCHVVNKAVVQQNCVETLNWHGQPLKQEAAFSIQDGNFCDSLIVIISLTKVIRAKSKPQTASSDLGSDPHVSLNAQKYGLDWHKS